MFKFSDIVEIQGQSECVSEKSVSNGIEMTENKNDKIKTCTELHQIGQLLVLRFQT